jgi:hypothetical protein
VDIRIRCNESIKEAILADPDDFARFQVTMLGAVRADFGRNADLRCLLASIGTIQDESHVFVSVACLQDLVGDRARDPQWTSGLESMVRYARTKGWVNAAGDLRAHIVWAD